MLSDSTIRELLQPFGVGLNDRQIWQVRTYLELLVRWNQRINLTSIRTARECVSRHFGESFYLARGGGICGTLLDIGSGAGFPGLALKIVFPGTRAILLEPVGKKRAFLKEVARMCEMSDVEIRPERIENYAVIHGVELVNCVTVRSVGDTEGTVRAGSGCLRSGGSMCVWTTRASEKILLGLNQTIRWTERLSVPLSEKREIWIGIKLSCGEADRV